MISNSVLAGVVGVGMAFFLFLLLIGIIVGLISQDKYKITNREGVVLHNRIDANTGTVRESTSLKSTLSTLPCNTRFSRPDFATLPPGSVTIQSVGYTVGPITIFRGGFVDVISASASRGDLVLRVPPLDRNTSGTTIRVSNSGNIGDIVFTPLPGVLLCSESSNRITPLTTVYFTATQLNVYSRN